MRKDNYTMERYKNISTASSYVRIKLKKPGTNKILNIILENEDMTSYLATEQGLKTDNLGRFEDITAYKKFVENDYVNYMIGNEGKIFNIDFNELKKSVSKTRFGNENAAEKYINSYIYDSPMTFQELNVNNEEQLIDKYFDFDSNGKYGTLKKDYYKQLNSNPAFIALLIDLGFDVRRGGDIIPLLLIRRR